jgi:hypothetical protein
LPRARRRGAARKNSIPNIDSVMLIGVENCRRMELAERVLAASR